MVKDLQGKVNLRTKKKKRKEKEKRREKRIEEKKRKSWKYEKKERTQMIRGSKVNGKWRKRNEEWKMKR